MTFEPVIPLWGLASILGLGLVLGWFQYLRQEVYGLQPFTRMTLFELRVLIFIVITLLLANPQWTREVHHTRPPRVLVLFDASESMNTAEKPENPTTFVKLRDAFFRKVYPLWQDKFQMRFYTFSSQLYTSDPDKLRETEAVSGAATDIRGAILDALSQQGSTRPAAVVLLTDGNHNWGPEPTSDIFRPTPEEDPIPLIAVSTPSYGTLKKSLTIPQITLPNPVFSDEETEIRFQVVASTAGNRDAETRLKIDYLADPETETWEPIPKGEKIQQIALLGSSTEGSFQTTFPKGGHYRIRITASAPGLGAATETREIDVEPGRWRIAYYCGRAGWMSSSLIRRIVYVPRYALKAAIGHGPRRWSYIATSQGSDSEPKKNFMSFEEVAYEADLYIFHGLDRDQLNEIPDEMIRERIEKGAVVLIISGNSEPLPQSFLIDRGIEKISPVDFSAGFFAPAKKDPAFTSEAANHHVTQSPLILGIADRLPAGDETWGGIRPTPDSQVLMKFVEGGPALVVKTVGDARSAYLGIGDLWRWQFQPGDDGEPCFRAYGALVDRLIRWLLLGEEAEQGKPQILISQSRIPLGKTLEIGVQYTGTTEEATSTLRLTVRDPNQRTSPRSLRSQPGGFFSTRFTPAEAGEYEFTASIVENPSASDTVKVLVEPFSIETAVSGAREDLLRNLAEKTGGLWVDLEDISEITKVDKLGEIHKPLILTRTVTEPVMAAPWFFVALIFLLGLEWSLRRIKDLP